MKNLVSCKKDVIKYSRLLYERNLITAAGGNVSMRYGDQIVVTASGVSLRDVDFSNLLVCDMDGNVLENPAGLKPSKETVLHLKVYKAREDIDSIIHVHPTFSVAYSINDRLIPILTASAKMKIIEVPMAGYANPGTTELSEFVDTTVRGASKDIHAIVLKAHGIIAYEAGMSKCFDIAELVEDTARISYYAEMLSQTDRK